MSLPNQSPYAVAQVTSQTTGWRMAEVTRCAGADVGSIPRTEPDDLRSMPLFAIAAMSRA